MVSASSLAPATFDAEVEVTNAVRTATADGSSAVRIEHDGESITVVGAIPPLARGERVHLVGRWQTDRRLGRQICADAVTPVEPMGSYAVEHYLSSIRHIGPARARALVIRHAQAVIEVLDADPASCFAALRGMSARAATEAAASWQEHRTLRALHLLLAPRGLAHLVSEEWRRYGPAAVHRASSLRQP